MKKALVSLLVASLLLTTPGLECWAQIGISFEASPQGDSVSPLIPLPLLNEGASYLSPAPTALSLPPAALSNLQPLPTATTKEGPRLTAIPPVAPVWRGTRPRSGWGNWVSSRGSGAKGGTAAAGVRQQVRSRAIATNAEAAWASAARPFDQTGSPVVRGSLPLGLAWTPAMGLGDSSGLRANEPSSGAAPQGPPLDLKLSNADQSAVDAFAADLHAKLLQKFPEYGFTTRDYYAWGKFIRFFTPSMGLTEALKNGAIYVYGDRLETVRENADFDALLNSAVSGLHVSRSSFGLDPAKAAELLKAAEPPAESIAADEDSPFQVPLSRLVPDKAHVELISTPTTLKRIDAAYRAFALRDYMLMVGPPATEKSAIPKLLASEYGIPHLAVALHPGIGTFELVGGYQPKEVRIGSLEEARRIVGERLGKAQASSDYSELLESASKVYGGGSLTDVIKAVEGDLALSAAPRTHEAMRRLMTLAHGLQFGAASLAWRDGYLTYALKRDIWITFEELNAAPTEVLEFLNEFMRSHRLVLSQKLGETTILKPRPGGRFMLWATMNPETDSNREVLARTLKNRWRVKYFGPLPSGEQAEILERKFGLPSVLALALVENIHKPTQQQATNRVIGGDWRDGYSINLRHLLKVAKRWKYFMDQEERETGRRPNDARQRFLLGREAYSVYAGMMRLASERSAFFTTLDHALRLGGAEQDLLVHPDRIEDLGDRLRIGDVTLRKGSGGPFVPEPNPDYLADSTILARLYEYAKALALGEPLLLMGETAVGKTSDLEHFFFRLTKNLRYKNLDSDTAIEEVVGGFAPGDRQGQYVFQEGILPKAMEEVSGAFLDELNLNPLVEWLNTLVDDGRLYLPHRIVEGHPDLVAAANPPGVNYEGRILLSPAVRSRWTERWVDEDNSPARLQRLMNHWLRGGTVYSTLIAAAGLLSQAMHAYPSLSGFSGLSGLNANEPNAARAKPWEGLLNLWPFKKKARGDKDSAPPTLEQLLKERGVSTEEWPAYRERVGRIQTIMRVVGSTAGRDAKTRWEPGDQWGFYSGKNTFTYPLEHLLTHADEEVVGLADHEGFRREITRLDERLPLVRKYVEDPVRAFLFQALENPRANSRGVHRLPGAQRYLNAASDRYLPENPAPLKAEDLKEPALPPQGDGVSAFSPALRQYPHIEFLWAANYFARYGKPPPAWECKLAKDGFERALPAMKKVFDAYPRDAEPSEEEKLAYTLKALQTIDDKILPLYEPLVRESEGKLGRQLKNKKGKESQRRIEEHARGAAKELDGKIKENPKPVPAQDRKTGKNAPKSRREPGNAKPEALTIEEIAQTQREQLLNDPATPYQRYLRPVSHLSNATVSYLENIFQKNARPRDVGYFNKGKRPEIKRAMRREGEGSGKRDVWLQRTQKSKRRYAGTLLVDGSGSMADFVRVVISAFVLLTDSLDRLTVALEGIVFAETAHILKDHKTPLTPEVKEKLVRDLEAWIGHGGTHDANALKLALERIEKEDANRRFIFVITDGDGNGPSKLADVFPLAEAAGVYVVGIGIGAGMAYVKKAYRHYVLVDDISQLPLALKKTLEEYIRQQESAVRSRGAGRAAGFSSSGLNALPSSGRRTIYDEIKQFAGFYFPGLGWLAQSKLFWRITGAAAFQTMVYLGVSMALDSGGIASSLLMFLMGTSFAISLLTARGPAWTALIKARQWLPWLSLLPGSLFFAYMGYRSGVLGPTGNLFLFLFMAAGLAQHAYSTAQAINAQTAGLESLAHSATAVGPAQAESEKQLLEKTRGVLSELGTDSLPLRMKHAALEGAMQGLESALASGQSDAIAIASQRLRALLSEARSS